MTIAKSLRVRAIVFMAVVSMLLAACGSTSGSGGGGGIKGGPGVNLANHTITLGVLTPLTGPVAAPIGIPLTAGVQLYFSALNNAGGIDGFQIQLIQRDTQYDPAKSVAGYNDIHTDVAMLAESLGTAPTVAIKDLAAQDHMLVSAATLASSLAREKYLILIGTPYRLQVENAFDYVTKKLGDTNPKTGIIYQNDDYGQDGLTGYQESVKAYNLNDVGQAPYGVTDTSFVAEVSQMKAAAAKYVFLTTTPSITAKIILTAHALGYDPQWILQSPAFHPSLLLVPGLGALMTKEAWVVSQGASWGDTSKPGMAEMLSDIGVLNSKQQPDPFFEFGFTESKITAAILKKAADNKDLSRDGIFKAFESLRNVDLGGLLPNLNYGSSSNPDQRVPSRDSSVYALDPTVPTGAKDLSGDFTGSAAAVSKF
ncbi:MAG TPA: ABC transporter substrate-binding protein [Ktedonobacterales bacterium]|nr:ABC transporter substrate-binding protein [Ktedonobacterales bacterium]